MFSNLKERLSQLRDNAFALKKYGMRINDVDSLGRTSLEHALKQGHAEDFEFFVERIDGDLLVKDGLFNLAPLFSLTYSITLTEREQISCFCAYYKRLASEVKSRLLALEKNYTRHDDPHLQSQVKAALSKLLNENYPDIEAAEASTPITYNILTVALGCAQIDFAKTLLSHGVEVTGDHLNIIGRLTPHTLLSRIQTRLDENDPITCFVSDVSTLTSAQKVNQLNFALFSAVIQHISDDELLQWTQSQNTQHIAAHWLHLYLTHDDAPEQQAVINKLLQCGTRLSQDILNAPTAQAHIALTLAQQGPPPHASIFVPSYQETAPSEGFSIFTPERGDQGPPSYQR